MSLHRQLFLIFERQQKSSQPIRRYFYISIAWNMYRHIYNIIEMRLKLIKVIAILNLTTLLRFFLHG